MSLDRNFILNLAHRDTDINEYLLTLYNLIVQGNYKTVVEIGAGQSTYALTAAVNETKGEFYSIDLTQEARLRSFPEGEGILDNEIRYHFIQGNDLQIVKKWTKEIDFLFIDSDHSYDHVRLQLEDWLPWVRKGGMIALHDTAQTDEIIKGCRQALNEFLKLSSLKYSQPYYRAVHLLDTKLLGMSILVKI